ncbi:type 1 glycerol-3-phosphate oxidase [Lacticaseibacillus parakribbianus]|uniref:type 1 glycerol-3-phosphate oxidase n=1 Tax=Lacticaseibacillus parakribbianus TaxID=2970927 RepID=UPI0021CB81A2|nr:type 1 glycerol-3-phosphate oxidase [Lacticaseibacillus parakribbianus]
MAFSAHTRAATVQQLAAAPLDLLIIGGGITGAGVALQAAASDLRVGLLEMQDFGAGTSSRSTKLVHGGIRYLKTFDVQVVADTVRERAVIQGIAPHIPRPTPMLLPLFREPGATFDDFSVKVAMDLYDRLAGITGPPYANTTLDAKAVAAAVPALATTNLTGGGVYLDYVNNDARLVIENLKAAVARGALAVSHAEVLEILHDDQGQATGVRVHDHLNGGEFTVSAKVLLNATGPWSDQLREADAQLVHTPTLRPTKGVHLVVDASVLQVPQPLYFDSGLGDGRMIFVVPREGKTYFGTTDTDYRGDYRHPRVEQPDVDYLLRVINRRFPQASVRLADIEAAWAGLRPLIAGGDDYNGGASHHLSAAGLAKLVATVQDFAAGTADQTALERVVAALRPAEAAAAPSTVSRGSALTVEQDGLLTLAGGKLTDYRKMAAGAMALIRKHLAERFGVAATVIDSTKLPVSGGDFAANAVAAAMQGFTQLGVAAGLPEADAKTLAERFGSNTDQVLTHLKGGAAPGLSLAESASLRYCVAEEAVLTPVDYLLRRTTAMLFHADERHHLAEPVTNELARLLRWRPDETRGQLQRLAAAYDETSLRELKRAGHRN